MKFDGFDVFDLDEEQHDVKKYLATIDPSHVTYEHDPFFESEYEKNHVEGYK